MLDRRQFMMAAGSAMAGMAGALSGCGRLLSHRGKEPVGALDGLNTALAAIESRSGGRLGVSLLDTNTGARAAHRGNERFPMCSTFKMLAVAATLHRVDAGREQLDRRVQFGSGDLLAYSPATRNHVGDPGMTVERLCEAAMVLSDNTAANLLLAGLGGTAAVTAFARSLGDTQTRLDRMEPDLNESSPGDPRDTTTPAAMLADLHRLVLQDALSTASRDLLIHWLVNNRTGDARLRAGLPREWRAGDKTGSGPHGTTNDIGILWPPGRQPLLICVYLTESPRPSEEREATIASVARAIAASA